MIWICLLVSWRYSLAEMRVCFVTSFLLLLLCFFLPDFLFKDFRYCHSIQSSKSIRRQKIFFQEILSMLVYAMTIFREVLTDKKNLPRTQQNRDVSTLSIYFSCC